MKRIRAALAATTREHGFALVGVVMFVLVLTILGLSLFSLSSIEGQFLNQSNSRAEAFYAASEGLERARFVLSTTRDLGSVGTWVEGGLIVNAMAMQLKGAPATIESTGSVAWNSGNPVIVRVLAVQRGQRSFLETRLEAVRNEDLYRRLFTLSGDLKIALVNPDPPGTYPTLAQTWLTGEIWKNGPDNTWQSAPGGATARPGNDVVPDPSVAGYVSRSAPPPTMLQPDIYSLNAGLLGASFFKSTGNTAGWTLRDDNGAGSPPVNNPPIIRVRGKAIWLLDHGVRFDQKVTVEPLLGLPLPGDALIIVAGKNRILNPGDDDYAKGIAFKSGIESNSIPIILVTDGTVSIEHKVANATGESRLNFLSVYAHDAYLLGPHGSGGPATSSLRVRYPPSDPLMNTLFDLLYDLGLLPNTTAGLGGGTLPVIAGTWRDLTESNPS